MDLRSRREVLPKAAVVLLSAAAIARGIVGFVLSVFTLFGPGILVAAWYLLFAIAIWRGIRPAIWIAELANLVLVLGSVFALQEWGHLHGGEVIVLWAAPALLEVILVISGEIVIIVGSWRERLAHNSGAVQPDVAPDGTSPRR